MRTQSLRLLRPWKAAWPTASGNGVMIARARFIRARFIWKQTSSGQSAVQVMIQENVGQSIWGMFWTLGLSATRWMGRSLPPT